MKWAWLILACVVVAAGICGGREWLLRDRYQIELVTDVPGTLYRKYDRHTGRVWVFVNRAENPGWIEVK